MFVVSFFKKIDLGLEKSSQFLLVLSVALMLALAVTTIVLRWFNLSYPWLDPAVRHLVFITTFLGGVVATGRGTHIGIDILSKYFETKKNWQALLWMKRFISLVSCVTLIWLISASRDFAVIEFEYGKEAFLGIHSGYLVSIIPVGFALIAYRFGTLFLLSLFESPEEIAQRLSAEEVL